MNGKLKAAHVRTREEDGKVLSYVEGWFTIAEDNRIFGFDGWNGETVDSVCVWQGRTGGRRVCYYTAKIKVSLHAKGRIITREGSGFGGGSGDNPGEAHEMAIKEAEKDAMKRALMTSATASVWRSVTRSRGKSANPGQKPQTRPRIGPPSNLLIPIWTNSMAEDQRGSKKWHHLMQVSKR